MTIPEESLDLMPGRGRSHWKVEGYTDPRMPSAALIKSLRQRLMMFPNTKIKLLRKQHSGYALRVTGLSSAEADVLGRWMDKQGLTFLGMDPEDVRKLSKTPRFQGDTVAGDFHVREKGEDIAGAPGAFAVSDDPTAVDDLVDRCRNPSWEYPSWALSKVQLDEAKTVDDYPWRFFGQGEKRRAHGKLKVGRLGLVSYSQAKAHEKAGKMQHEWVHHSTVAGRAGKDQTTYRCSICGTKAELDKRGRRIYR